MRRTRSPRRGAFRRLFRAAVFVLAFVLIATAVVVLPWRWIAPPTTAFMVRERILGGETVDYQWTPWSEISPNVIIAVVAAEDQKFPTHRGFDLEAISDALERNRSGGRIRGGSTISQQVAKNLYLWPAQSFVRKGLEAYLTVWIELLWPKRRILEVYVNVAEFGPGTFGVRAASRSAFGKAPDTLTLREAAILAAVLPSPKRMSAARPSEYVNSRAGQIERAVRNLGGAGYLAELP